MLCCVCDLCSNFHFGREVFGLGPALHAGHKEAAKQNILDGTSKWSASITLTGIPSWSTHFLFPIANLLYSLSTYYPILKSNMYIIYFLPTFFFIIIFIWAKVYNTTFECRIFFFFPVYLVGKFITLRYCFVKWILIFGDFLVFNKYPIAWSNN